MAKTLFELYGRFPNTRQARPPDLDETRKVGAMARSMFASIQASKGDHAGAQSSKLIAQQMDVDADAIADTKSTANVSGKEMPYNESHGHEADSAIFTWAVGSSRSRAGGRAAKYEILLYGDGCLSCDCPGWLFHRRADGAGEKTVRGCKHTDAVNDEALDLRRRYQRGEKLPQLSEPTPTTAPAAGRTLKSKEPESAPAQKYGRVLDI